MNDVVHWGYTLDEEHYGAYMVLPSHRGEVDADIRFNELFGEDYYDGEPDFIFVDNEAELLTISGDTRSLQEWAASKDHPNYSDEEPWVLWDSAAPEEFGPGNYSLRSLMEPDQENSEDPWVRLRIALKDCGYRLGSFTIEPLGEDD